MTGGSIPARFDGDLNWLVEARCREVDPDLWFPEKGDSARHAKEICVKCPVKDECLDYALAIWPVRGIWGGHSERELRKMKDSVA